MGLCLWITIVRTVGGPLVVGPEILKKEPTREYTYTYTCIEIDTPDSLMKSHQTPVPVLLPDPSSTQPTQIPLLPSPS